MCVEMSLSQLDCLAEHHAKRHSSNGKFVGHSECLANVVAVLYESLSGKGGVEGFQELLALEAAVDDDSLCSTCLCHLHALADGVDESLLAERFHDARHADDADAALNAKTRIEGSSGYLCAAWNADGY